jgi:hypothetical protein
MKKPILVFLLIADVFLGHAQRFFYIDPANDCAGFITQNLKKASQFISKSALDSDCTVQTNFSVNHSGKALFKITLKDSATFKTIFEAAEEYKYSSVKLKAELFVHICVKTFIEKHMKQMMLCAENNNHNTFMLLLKEKKDKT